MIDRDFWRGRSVFLTGHTGFKGSWLSLWLQEMSARVAGFALRPPSTPSLFEEAAVGEGMTSTIADVRDLARLTDAMRAAQPDVVFHLAAQSLVRRSYADPIETYGTNVMGTANVLQAARSVGSVRAVIIVTTDKCYENNEWEWGYRENDRLGGHDPYSNSKACAELVTQAFRDSFFGRDGSCQIASVRAGNVIGGGDWAEDRLLPDLLAGFAGGTPVRIRNPRAVRPWQHVLEPLSGYMLLAQRLVREPNTFEGAWNFGPRDDDARTVGEVADVAARHWGDGAAWTHDASEHPKEAHMLRLDWSKARQRLGWQPRWSVDQGVQATVDWYRHWLTRPGTLALREATQQTVADYLGGTPSFTRV